MRIMAAPGPPIPSNSGHLRGFPLVAYLVAYLLKIVIERRSPKPLTLLEIATDSHNQVSLRQVKSRLNLKVSDLGPVPLKNIAERMRAYALTLDRSVLSIAT